MYERLCVYINMEQNSRTNNRKKKTRKKFLYFFECMDTLHVYFLCCCCYGSSSIPSKKLKILFEAQSEEKRLPNVTKRENCGKWKIQHEVPPQLGANREGGGEVRRHL